MAQLKVAVFIGSLRKDSYNRRLALAVEKLAPNNVDFKHIRIDNLPFYSQDFDDDYPDVAQQLKQDIETADALLFATPEYNRSVPGVLKNAIDIASRPWGTNSFAGKPGGLIGASIGAPGTSMAQQHLRNIMAYLDAPILGQPEVYIHFTDELISPDGTINKPGTQQFLQGFVDKYVAWVERFNR